MTAVENAPAKFWTAGQCRQMAGSDCRFRNRNQGFRNAV